MRERRHQAAQQIEQQVGTASHPIFHVVPEYVQGQHVAEQMSPPAVQEHRREESRKLKQTRMMEQTGRHHAEHRDQDFGPIPKRQDNGENEDVQRD